MVNEVGKAMIGPPGLGGRRTKAAMPDVPAQMVREGAGERRDIPPARPTGSTIPAARAVAVNVLEGANP
jgi:hypothetical protein